MAHDTLSDRDKAAARVRLNAKAKGFMQGLVYPAFLGTFIVSFCQESNRLLAQDLFSLGLVLLLYFGTLYAETQTLTDEDYSTFKAFPFDVLEVAIMFCIFTGLSIVPFKGYNLNRPDLVLAAMAAVFLLPLLWRLTNGNRSEHLLDGLCLAATLTCVVASLGIFTTAQFGWFTGTKFANADPPKFMASAWDRCATAVLWVLFAVYFCHGIARTFQKRETKPQWRYVVCLLPVVVAALYWWCWERG